MLGSFSWAQISAGTRYSAGNNAGGGGGNSRVGIFFFPFMISTSFLLMNVFFAIMDKNFQQYDREYAIQQRELAQKRALVMGGGGLVHAHDGGAGGVGGLMSSAMAQARQMKKTAVSMATSGLMCGWVGGLMRQSAPV